MSFACRNGSDPIRFSRVTGESSIGWAFLYLATVLLPIALIGSVLVSTIEKARTTRLAQVRSRLLAEAESFGRRLTQREALLSMLNRLYRDQATGFVHTLERRAPGAFRWVFWDGTGTIIDLPAHLGMPGKIIWQEFATKYLMRGATSVELFRTNKIDRVFQEKLQRLLGPHLSAATFMSWTSFVHRMSWMGAPCIAFWERFFDFEEKVPTSRVLAKSPSERLAGAMAFVLPRRLPEGFWDDLCFDERFGGDLVTSAYLAIQDLDRPQRLRIRGLKRPPRGLGRALYRRFLKRDGETVTLGRWLVAAVSGIDPATRRFFLLRDLSGLERRYDRTTGWVFRLAVLVLVLGTVFFVGLYQGWAGDLSLVWKISGLFGVAILLPFIGLLLSGTAFLANEEAQGKTQLGTRFRECAGRLRSLEKDFPNLIGRSLRPRLAQFAAVAGTAPRLADLLQREIDARRLSNFYITDPEGNLEFMGRAATSPQLRGPMKLMLYSMFCDLTARPVDSSPLAGYMKDEFKSVLQDAESIDIISCLRLRSFKFAQSEFFGMSMLITLEGQRRLLFVAMAPHQIQAGFYRREFLENRFARATPPGDWRKVELGFLSRSERYPSFPAGTPFAEVPALANFPVDQPDCQGETSMDGEPIAWFSPAGEKEATHRVIFWCSLSPLRARIRELTRLLIGGGVVIIAVAILLGLQLAMRLLGPVWQLEEQVTEVGRGNLQVGMPALGRDELGRLAGSFNDMIRGLRERERMRAYVSETVLEAVRDEAGNDARRGISRTATILFCDVRNFTTLSETHGAETMFLMLNGFLGSVEQPIRECGGRIDKFIGDAVMAVFLADGPEQAWGAVRAALGMKDCLRTFNNRRQAEGAFTIEIGIGINTGPVMLGDVGGERRKDLTVIGDAVNLAARLEAASKHGRHTRIVLSEDTWNQVRDRVEVEEMAITEVKGKQQSVRIFELVRPLPEGTIS